MMMKLDSILDRISMYKLVLYYLGVLLLCAIFLSFFKVFSYTPLAIVYSVAVLLVTTELSSRVLAHLFGAFAGSYSSFITALILACILSPVEPVNVLGTGMLILVSFSAIASKYVFTYKHKHIFNPAGFGAVVAGLAFNSYASWWVAGTTYLIPIILIGGLLVTRKIFRLDAFYSFAVTSLAVVALLAVGSPASVVWQTLLHTPLLFMGLTMLTDPSTMPATRDMRIAYGVLVGIWFVPGMHIGSFYFSPELALMLGNLFAFFVSPKGRHTLTLIEKNEVAENTYELAFESDTPLSFTAGQYMEWTVKENGKEDGRGNRRYFSLVNAPEERTVRLAFRLSSPSSSFKQTLMSLERGEKIGAGQLAGDFTLPKDRKQKVAFIAGGIGITPIRSMTASMLHGDKRDAILLYSNKTEKEIAYRDLFENARREIAMSTVYAVTNETPTSEFTYPSPIDAKLIETVIPDYKDRIFYISGPSPMVDAMLGVLDGLGVSDNQIKTDYFPGYA